MATLGSQYLTLADWGKRVDKNGKVEAIAEILSQQNEILSDMLFTEGNLPTGHRVTIRTGLPSTYWKMIGQGSPISKSQTAQVDEHSGILEAWSEVDKDLAELGGNVGALRLSESEAFLEAMNQEMAATLLYGSSTNPEEFVGFTNRYSSLSGDNAQNIISAGGSGSDNTSIWLVSWDKNGCYGVFPKGSKAGLSHEDMGMQTLDSTNGAGQQVRQRVYQDHWCWKAGLVVKDWRYAVRIPNVDISDLSGITGTQATTAATNIVALMSSAIARLPKQAAGGKRAFYVNRTVADKLRLMGLQFSNSAVTVQPAIDQFGQNIFQLSIFGVPIKIVDQLTNAEQLVT